MAPLLEDYEVLDTIGAGSYGLCKKIKRKSDGKLLVWKEIDYGSMTEKEKEMLVSEVNLLRELKHKNIVRYFDRIIDRTNTMIYIIMEYCEGGDLATLILRCHKEGKYIEEEFIWKVFYQLVIALKECHRHSKGHTVLHRDIKPANVFLDADHNVKLGDFGLARVLGHNSSFAKTFIGTPYYMSPEQMNNMSYNEKSDIWSLGCLLYELCALFPPFTASNQTVLAARIREGHFRRIPTHFSDDLNLMIKHMLTVEDDLRPSIDIILHHPKLRSHTESLSRQNSSGGSSGHGTEVNNARDSQSEEQRKDILMKLDHALKMREKTLEIKEKDLEKREKELNLKEKLLEEKIMRANAILVHCKEINYHIKDDIDMPNCPKVNAKSNFGKENMVNVIPEFKHKNKPNSELKRAELKSRLLCAKVRGLALRNAEAQAAFRSNMLLGLR